MAITNDPTTLIGKVREMAQDPDGLFFTDDQITFIFLELNGNSPRLAAADALDAIANNQALLLKKLSIPGPISLDGPAVAEALRKGAEALRAQELGIYNPGAMFDIIETNWDPGSWLDIVDNSLSRVGEP